MTTTGKKPPTIKYRTAKASDIPYIAKLLGETFEGTANDDDTGKNKIFNPSPLTPPWDLVRGKLAEDRLKESFSKRFYELVQSDTVQHVWIVAVDPDANDRVAGFMELGRLPSPVPVVVSSKQPEKADTTTKGSNNIWAEAHAIESPIERQSRPEMPYLANLAVDKDYRRQKLGTTLVQLAIKIARKWCTAESQEGEIENDNAALYLAVERDNGSAVGLYDRLHFSRIIDENEKLSAKARSQLKRKPRLYFEKKLFVTDESNPAGV